MASQNKCTRIYLVQHGLAVDKATDSRKPLSDTGIEQTRQMAAALAGRLTVKQICHSGKLRARETAELLAEELAVEDLAHLDGMAPMDDVDIFAGSIKDAVMYVGHLPHLDRLAALLVAGDQGLGIVKFRNSAVVCLEREAEDWRVCWVVTPETCPS
jgi:phosphohistidine phosphatase